MFRVFLLFIAGITYYSCGQSSKRAEAVNPIEMRDRIKADITAASEYVLQKNYEQFFHYMHPDIIEKCGGREAAITMVKDAMEKQLVEMNMTIDSIAIGEPGEIVSFKNQLQCVVPKVVFGTLNGDKVKLQGSTVGCSFNKGKSWVFLDVDGGDEKFVKQGILSDKLAIPDYTPLQRIE